MLRTTKILFADKAVEDDTKKLIEEIKKTNAHLNQIHQFVFSAMEGFVQSVIVLTENVEELNVWKGILQEYEKDKEEVEYDFYTFFDDLSLPFPFRTEGIGEEKYKGLRIYFHKLYSFDFEGDEEIYKHWIESREEK